MPSRKVPSSASNEGMTSSVMDEKEVNHPTATTTPLNDLEVEGCFLDEPPQREKATEGDLEDGSKTTRGMPYQTSAGPWPEDPGATTSVSAVLRKELSKWTFSYMNPILRLGGGGDRDGVCGDRRGIDEGEGEGREEVGRRRRELTADDLYAVPRSMEADVLDRKFALIYAQERGHLMRTLWRIAAPMFVPAGYCQVVVVIAQVSIPVLVWQLLRILEEDTSPASSSSAATSNGAAPFFAALVLVASVLNSFANHRQRHLALKSGVAVRAALVGAVYRQTLTLTPARRAGLTSGEISNLVAIDAQKLFEVTQEGHLLWSCPLQMVLVAVTLATIVGPATLAGVAVMLCFGPAVKRVAKNMMAIRKARVAVTDRRANTVSAMLRGMTVTKLNNHESRYLDRISSIRAQEVQLLRKDLMLWALAMAMQFICPVLGAGSAMAAHVLADEENILRTADAFTVLLLFSALRFPINYAGRLAGKLAQAADSERRVAAFIRLDKERHWEKEGKWREGKIIDSGGRSEADEKDVAIGKSKGAKGGGEGDRVEEEEGKAPLLSVKNGTFCVGFGNSSSSSFTSGDGGKGVGFTVSGVNLSLHSGEVLAVLGPIGSGKSVLIDGLLGEAPAASCPGAGVVRCLYASPSETEAGRGLVCTGDCGMKGKAAIAAQVPFILNATIRGNVLFGLPYDRDRYEATIDACCLGPDIEQVGPAGDMTEIGERGVTLSGGQKQRINLARVLYSAPDVAFFDDPLSALDAGTSRKIFDRVFDLKSSDNDTRSSLLSSTAVVLVTHAAQFLPRVDKIMFLLDGKQRFLGSWEDLDVFEPADDATRTLVETIKSSVHNGSDGGHGISEVNMAISGSGTSTLKSPSTKTTNQRNAELGALIKAEQREHGLSSFKTWLTWYKYAGGVPFTLFLIVLYTVEKGLFFLIDLWYAKWASAYDGPIELAGIAFPAQTDGRQAQLRYLAVHWVIFALAFLSALLRSVWLVRGGARCSQSLFELMTKRLLHAPIGYFETTPLGRILNRFTYDMEALDMTLTISMAVLTLGLSWFVASLVIMSTLLPWLILALVPITLLYFFVQLHYRRVGADLQRLDAVSRSPLQAMLAEGIDGAPTIRAFRKEAFFLEAYHNQQDRNNSALINFISAQRWLGVRTELLGSAVTFVACVLVATMHHNMGLSVGESALLVSWSILFTFTMSFVVDAMADTEASITSIERVEAMLDIPQEKDMETSLHTRLEEDWPSRGLLEFESVDLRYRTGLPLALNGLSFSIPPGKRCGVVGRTGAGKSSLTVALFRLVELERGTITLDGIDLATLGLNDVRGRPGGMVIIPQDPVLHAGTVRECLDPFGTFADGDILEALRTVRLLSAVEDMAALNYFVHEGGVNFSVGERQLLCLARAILAQPRVLVLDEATASVDRETDAFIQKMLRLRFVDTTILCIAHRLQTIMDFDLILAMAEGKAVEFGSPKNLLSSRGLFSELVHAAGDDSAASLISLVRR